MQCKFGYDTEDHLHRKQIEAERDKAVVELERLFERLNDPNIPVEAVEQHIEHHMSIYRNATSILEQAEIILTEEQAKKIKEIMPFRLDGSNPKDCLFQCGGNSEEE